MSTIADQMKDNINAMNGIKTKLIRSAVWTADTVSKCLSKDTCVESVTADAAQDRLYLKMKDGTCPDQNRLELDTYNRFTNYTHSMINKHQEQFNELLTDSEKKYIKNTGLKKISSMLYHISAIKDQRLIIIDL